MIYKTEEEIKRLKKNVDGIYGLGYLNALEDSLKNAKETEKRIIENLDKFEKSVIELHSKYEPNVPVHIRILISEWQKTIEGIKKAFHSPLPNGNNLVQGTEVKADKSKFESDNDLPADMKGEQTSNLPKPETVSPDIKGPPMKELPINLEEWYEEAPDISLTGEELKIIDDCIWCAIDEIVDDKEIDELKELSKKVQKIKEKLK